MKRTWKFIARGTGTIMVLLFASLGNYGVAAEYANGVVTCEDGRVLYASPFASPDRMCGEVEFQLDPIIDPDFTFFYGDRPSYLNTELEIYGLRRAQFRWERELERWGGIVEPEDLIDPNNAKNPDAIREAIELGELDEEYFNPDRIAQVTEWFVEYGLGSPYFILRDAIEWDEQNNAVMGKRLVVKFTKFPPTFYISGNVLEYPALGIASAQVIMDREGICFNKLIGLLIGSGVSGQPCPIIPDPLEDPVQ